ncbi:hypothetical protein ABE85_02275 [Mitsuaria sp. 7]|nr:hypothetical protein ABE85_02275 [Mitsuaria sp. 7]
MSSISGWFLSLIVLMERVPADALAEGFRAVFVAGFAAGFAAGWGAGVAAGLARALARDFEEAEVVLAGMAASEVRQGPGEGVM